MRNTKYLGLSVGLSLLLLTLSFGLEFSLPQVANAQGPVIYVAENGTDNVTCGASTGSACRTIKYAVETRAQTGDEIHVAVGTYTQTITVNTPGLKIYGADPYQTIIDGENLRGPMVSFGTGLTSTSVFSGFTVQNGVGGGLAIVGSSPTIQSAVIQSNEASIGTGGGIHISGNASPVIQESIICSNNLIELQNSGSTTVNVTGNWWGTNSPQTDETYSGLVNATPPMSVSLEVQQQGSGVFPGGTIALPAGVAGNVKVTMAGGGYLPPDGTQVNLIAFRGVFDTGTEAKTVSLVDGIASAVFTPTSTLPVIISPLHNCRPSEAILSLTIDVTSDQASLFLPVIFKNFGQTSQSPVACQGFTTDKFTLIPYIGAPIDHPDYLHGDLNLSLRGYNPVTGAPLALVDYSGDTDPLAPQLPGLFGNQRTPTFTSGHQANAWVWACGAPHGCKGGPLTDWPLTVLGMQTSPGETLYTPSRVPTIYSNSGKNFKAMVLYAEEQRLTLGYTRDDSVANGYAIQIENISVDPALLALYQAQVGNDGYRCTGVLPGLTQNQAIGSAIGSEVLVAVRDRGQFMDPRSRKDWWMGRLSRGIRLLIDHSPGE